MKTIEIPMTEWARALDEFSRVHDGWLVSLDVLDPGMGAQPEVDDLPLVGVTAERVGGATHITILAGRTPAAHVAHTVQTPTHVRIERTDEGADVAMQIESADGTTLILRFRTAALPETVDGVVKD